MPSFLRHLSVFLVALGLLYLGLRYGMREVTVEQESATAVVGEDPEWADWHERRFDALGFSIRHPREYPTANGADPTYPAGTFLTGGATPVYTVMLPKTNYRNTNFVHAYVTVALGREEAATGDAGACALLARPGATAEPMTRRESFGGTEFAVSGMSGAAGGGVRESIVYHAWHNGRCLEMTANLVRTAATGGTQVNRVEVWEVLTDIVHTFRSVDADR